MTGHDCSIKLADVSLVYDLYHDRTTSLKELVVNFVTRRSYTKVRKQQLYALRNINLKIRNGERIGVIGLNGSGKTTLLRVISKLLSPTNGSIEVRGTVQPLIEIGAGFNYEFSGRENIYLNGAMLGFDKKSIEDKEEEIIDFAELRDFIDVPVKYYSSGMLLRLAFTIATMVKPEILVFDEMLSAGDIGFIQKAKLRIDRLLNSARIIVLVSHDLGLIRSLATRVLVLDKGEIVFDGDPQESVDFYYDVAQRVMEEKKAQCQAGPDPLNEKSTCAQATADVLGQGEEERTFEVLDMFVSKGVNKRGPVMPGDTTHFTIRFSITLSFEKLFLNLVILDRMGAWVAHMRNDAYGITIQDFLPGEYTLTISVQNIPFRTGKYKYYFRIVGTTITDQINQIFDSDQLEFQIQGDKREHTLLQCTWNFVRADEKYALSGGHHEH
jgi:ABC-type polysaccharide/polyol phosphate transport system ATPase subunit